MNMKKVIACALAFCVIGGTLSYDSVKINNNSIVASAEDSEEYTEGTYELLTYKKYSDHIEISGCDKDATEVVIPETIEDLPVTILEELAFGYCTSLELITLPDSITTIGIGAFEQDKNLKSITISANITNIEERAFSGCESIESITLPDNITTIGEDAFSYCINLKSITIPDGITSIEDGTFVQCKNLESIIIPDSVTNIGSYAFCSCESLESITIPDNITKISYSAFIECKSLKSITIPDGVTSIGSYAFYECSSLEFITIPDSVKSIGNDAFFGTLWFENKIKESPFVIVNNILIDGKNCTENNIVIPDNVVIIGESAFDDCQNIESLTFPETVTDIGIYAFRKCKNLKSITFSKSVKNIDYGAFKNCTSLESILIPEGVTSLKELSFDSCTNLETIEIPKSVSYIGSRVFEKTLWLENKRKENPLVIVNNILIDGQTFSGDAVIPDGVTSIADGAFFDRKELSSVILPDSITNIGEDAFYECNSLKSITIPESVTIIDYGAFAFCKCLESITIKNPKCKIYNNDYTITSIATIYGYEGSTAQAYAEKYERKFELIENAPTTAEKLLIGDANCDNEVNIADATAIIQSIGNKDKYALSEQGEKNANCYNTGDGVTGMDAMAIQKLEANLIDKLPEMP